MISVRSFTEGQLGALRKARRKGIAVCSCGAWLVPGEEYYRHRLGCRGTHAIHYTLDRERGCVMEERGPMNRRVRR